MLIFCFLVNRSPNNPGSTVHVYNYLCCIILWYLCISIDIFIFVYYISRFAGLFDYFVTFKHEKYGGLSISFIIILGVALSWSTQKPNRQYFAVKWHIFFVSTERRRTKLVKMCNFFNNYCVFLHFVLLNCFC